MPGSSQLPSRERIRNTPAEVDPRVHFQKGKSPFHSLLEFPCHLFGVARMCVTIYPHLIAKLPTSQLIRGSAVGLTRQIHQSHLNSAHTTGLPAMMPELFDLAEDSVHIAGVLSHQPALEH